MEDMLRNKLFFIFIVIFFLIYCFISPYSSIFGKVIFEGNTKEKVLYLTFDDGPGTETEGILDILDEKNVSATFFIVGQRIVENPEILIEISEKGHSLGVHSMTHPYLYKNLDYEIKEEKILIETLTGKEITLFRPPYGFRTPFTISKAEELGLKTITWTSFPMDYAKEKEDIVSFVLSNLSPGQIICLHDGPANRQETLAALPEIINGARDKGFEFGVLK